MWQGRMPTSVEDEHSCTAENKQLMLLKTTLIDQAYYLILQDRILKPYKAEATDNPVAFLLLSLK